MKFEVFALLASAFVSTPATSQSANFKSDFEQYYHEYLSMRPWGVASATSFKSFSLGQRVTLGEGTPFQLCKASKDINGRDMCWQADYDKVVCPFTPPAITCRSKKIRSRTSQLALVNELGTAFGAPVEASIVVLVDDAYPDPRSLRLSGRINKINIEASSPPDDFVRHAVGHFSEALGRAPEVSVDDKGKDVISDECKRRIDKLYNGKQSYSETLSAVKKCETDSLEKFFVSTTRSTYFSWPGLENGDASNKYVAMGVHRDLVETQVNLEIGYTEGRAEEIFGKKIDLLVKSAKDAQQNRAKTDF